MIVDDSLFRLIAGKIVHDSFSVSGFAQDCNISKIGRAGFKVKSYRAVKKKAEI